MMEINHYTIIGGITFIGIVALGLRHLTGRPLFGSNKNQGKSRSHNDMIRDMADHRARIKYLEEGQAKLFGMVESICEDVAFIRGRMEDKK